MPKTMEIRVTPAIIVKVLESKSHIRGRNNSSTARLMPTCHERIATYKKGRVSGRAISRMRPVSQMGIFLGDIVFFIGKTGGQYKCPPV
ncbi:Uncharacterised protein [Neisseria meningitidis]|nr:Uncharacterised protein [Neisseria meningitidis]